MTNGFSGSVSINASRFSTTSTNPVLPRSGWTSSRNAEGTPSCPGFAGAWTVYPFAS